MTKYMVFDQDRCFGCNACVVACQQEYGLPAAIKFNKVDVIVNMAAAINKDKLKMKPKVCNQCSNGGGNAPCQIICPANAITRNTATGVIETDRTKCVGCRLCTTATGCPYGMRSIDGSGKSVKCNFCIDRNDTEPYCVRTCPTKARKMAEVAPGGSADPAIGKVYYKSLNLDGTIS
jgi:Fe-S-cluster-containing dehydrogenase component